MKTDKIWEAAERIKNINTTFKKSLAPAIDEHNNPITNFEINEQGKKTDKLINLLSASTSQIENYIKEIQPICKQFNNSLELSVTLDILGTTSIDLSYLYITDNFDLFSTEDMPFILFKGSIFHDACRIYANFKSGANFQGCHFYKLFSLMESNFNYNGLDCSYITADYIVNLSNLKLSLLRCHNSVFNDKVFLNSIEVKNEIDFHQTTFQGLVNFNDSMFENTTDFSNCEFFRPPTFYKATLYPDTMFYGSKIGPYELEKSKQQKEKISFEEEVKQTYNDIIAYRTLKEIMYNNKAYQDEYRFHSLELLAQNKLDIIKFLTDPISRLFNIMYSIIYLFISHTGQSTWMPLAWWLTILVTWGSIFAGQDIATINPSLLKDNSNIWANNQYIGYWYSLQSISNPFSLFNTDVPFYPTNGFAAFLAHFESIMGVIIITLWIFALKRRFQKGE